MFYDQREFDIRCEWGGVGVSQLAPDSDAIVIVDVLSFSTCVDIVVANGVTVYPYQWKDESAKDYAHSLDAILANPRNKFDTGYSLSPISLQSILAGSRLVLPSPNGSFLSLATGQTPTFAACLRNAEAVAHKIQQLGKRISIIPAGEKWPDGSLRPAIEDLIGAGAVIYSLPGEKSPESKLAEAAFLSVREDLSSCLKRCSSGKELIGKGFPDDVDIAAMLNQSKCVPVLQNGAYRAA